MLNRPPPEPYKVVGAEHTYDCPLCGDTKGHMGLNIEKGVFFCYKCGVGGSVISLRSKTGIEWPLDVSARLYASNAGSSIIELLGRAYGDNLSKMIDRRVLVSDKEGGLDYVLLGLTEGCTYGTIGYTQQVCAGFSPKSHSGIASFGRLAPVAVMGLSGVRVLWNTENPFAHHYLASRGVTPDEALAWHLFAQGAVDAPIHGCVVIPSWCPSTGQMRNFMARSTDPQAKVRYMSPVQKSAWPMTILSPLAFNMASVGALTHCVLVEGPFDAIATARTGVPVAALCGKHLSENALLELKGWGLRTAIIMLDRGEIEDSLRIAGQLRNAGISVKVARITSKKDPGDSSPDEINQVLRSATEPDMMDVLSSIFAS